MMNEIQLKERRAELIGAREEIRALFKWLSQDYQTNRDSLMDRFKQLNALISEVDLILNSESENSGKNDADNSDKPM